LGVGIEVKGGDPASVVFSAPLDGGSPEEWVTGPPERRIPFQGSSFLQLDKERCRPAFAEALALRKVSGGGASHRQAQGCFEHHTGPPACHHSMREGVKKSCSK
jgi:hypothetical protein